MQDAETMLFISNCRDFILPFYLGLLTINVHEFSILHERNLLVIFLNKLGQGSNLKKKNFFFFFCFSAERMSWQLKNNIPKGLRFRKYLVSDRSIPKTSKRRGRKAVQPSFSSVMLSKI